MNARNLFITVAILLIIAGLFYWINSPGTTSPDELAKWGKFEGKPTTSWDANGRDMTLENDLTYIDPRGKRWLAEKGVVINGASIPQPFWSVIGGPFEGPYRNASIVHDAYCVSMSEPSQSVHKMFYEA